MTKLELYTKVSEELSQILDSTKVSKKVKDEIQETIKKYLEPKKGGSRSINPPLTIDGEIYYFDRFHQLYYPQEMMVMSGGKSKGYSKMSISKWNKTNRQIKLLEAKVTELMLAGQVEEATKIANEVKELKENLNLPSFYNPQEDVKNFCGCDLEVEVVEVDGVKYKVGKLITSQESK